MSYPPAWSIGTSKRSTDWRSGGNPGPGAYNARDSHKHSAPGWRLGTASRGGDRANNTPGPGSYNSPGKISNKAPQYGFGHKSATNLNSFTPGPGSYDATGLRGYDQVSPAYSFRLKTPTPGDNNRAPGPGAYDQNSRIQNLNSPSYKMGTSKRSNLSTTGFAPGPGAYATRPNSAYGKESGPKYGFGTSDRNALNSMSKTMPGPGAYQFKGEFESPSKGTSMVPRRPDSAMLGASRSPGPGAYNPDGTVGTQKSPAYRIGSASRDGFYGKNGAPGPGNYEPRLVQSTKNIKFGSSVRSPLNGNNKTPGPGSYDLHTKVGEGPKFVMNPRREGDFSTTRYVPGPGAYTPSVEFTKNTGPNYKVGTSGRSDFTGTKANPGPGQYDTRGRIAGPKWGFGSELRGKNDKNVNPGPGAYQHKHYVGDVPKYAFGSSPLKIHL